MIGTSDKRHKVFVLSMNRVGTKSTHTLLEWLGWKGTHYPKYFDDQNYEERIAGHELELEYAWAALKPFLDKYDAFSDVPFPALFEQAHRDFPDAKFILVVRDPNDWARSLYQHLANTRFNPYTRATYWPFLHSRPMRLLDASLTEFVGLYARHSRSVIDYFGAHAPQSLLVCELKDPAIARKIAQFLDSPALFEFPRASTENAIHCFIRNRGQFSDEQLAAGALAFRERPENLFFGLMAAWHNDANGKCSLAIKRQVFELLAKSPDRHDDLHDTFLQQGFIEDARLLSDTGLNCGSDKASVARQKGNECFAQQDYIQAASRYQEAASLDPECFWAHLQLFRSLRLLGRHSEARCAAEAGIRTVVRPSWVYPFLWFAIAKGHVGLIVAAVKQAVALSGGIRQSVGKLRHRVSQSIRFASITRRIRRIAAKVITIW